MRAWELGASTLGAPGEPLDTVIATLVASDARWIELRAAPDALVDTAMTAESRSDRRAALDAAGIAVLSLASGVLVGAPGPDDVVMRALEVNLQLAADLGARFLRVFPGIPVHAAPFDQVPITLGDRAAAEASAAARLSRAAAVASELEVVIALETHDSNPRGVDVHRVLSQAGEAAADQLGVVWDLLHPWRVGEAPETTWTHLGRYLSAGRGYVQVKDVASPSDLTPVLQGHGVVPLGDACSVLRAGGYAGPLSLEWERSWYPDIPTLAIALPVATEAVRHFSSGL